MKKALLSVLLLSSATSISAAAGNIDHDHHNKHLTDIVVVNLMEVFNALKEVVDIMQNFQNMIMKKIELLKKMEQEVNEREKSLAVKAKNMSPEAREKERMEIERLKNEIRIQAQSLEAKQQEEQMLIQQKIADKIKAFCKKMGWKIVLPGALYVDPEFDKTQEVIDGMNKEYVQTKQPKSVPLKK